LREEEIRKILQLVHNQELTIDEAVTKFKLGPLEDLGYAMLDHHRTLRRGQPETIFCSGKSLEQLKGIAQQLLLRQNNILATRASREAYEAIRSVAPAAIYHELAKIVVINQHELPRTKGKILIITAGTADMPVSEEAAITAEVLGNTVERLYDVGVAGIHRILSHVDRLTDANVLVVIAGMDGALPSVVGGLTDRPVIAVPTSVGYGASFQGIAALLTMLNSCASGITVVNIDNGYGAGYAASLINHLIEKQSAQQRKPDEK
jgi:hypothetical protein